MYVIFIEASVNTMQQRGSNTTMETEEAENSSTAPLSRGRHNSKLKVLVRSHAMREETSPPREPSPNHLHSPCIKLIPSREMSPECVNPVVVLSPSLHPVNSPCKSPQCLSPTTTLVPSPNSRCSPSLSASIDNVVDRFQPDHLQETPGSGFGNSSPKYLNKVNNSKNSDTASKQTSHNFRKKYICDCQNQNCIKCIKIQERNINNNLTNINNNAMGSPNTLTVSRTNSRGKLRQQSSSQGSFESSSNSPCLSRDSSSEQYTDTTGVDLEQFIPETLNRNAKDRALMLRIEQELVNLAKDRCKSHYKFPPMSSYQRMLVHRCAAYFGMDHNIEPTGKSVVVNKTKNTRIPDVEFKEHIKEDIIFSEEPRRSILKRDSNSIEDYSFKSPDRSFSLENRRSKSFEEREEEYEKVRRRIFNREMHDDSSEDFGWSEIPWSSTESDYSSRFRLQPPDIHRRHFGKLIKVHSEDTAEALRPCVAKSYSFGGYGGNISVLSRGDSVMSTHSAGPRLLTKQDSAASSVSWRLSPSSSGYKSQSQMSESVTPSPTSTPHPICDSRQNSNGSSETQEHHEGDSHIVWAVTDIQNVPKGSIIINPQTGKPLKNDDGSIYHYDPNNPPPSMAQSSSKPPPSPQKLPSKENTSASPKRTRSTKTSPTRKSNLTNSSTSPSLPFSPPMLSTAVPQRSFSYVQADNVVSLPQQHYSGYTSSFAPPNAPESSTVYQQPYIVYTAPYGVHVQQQYENRMEPPHIQDMGNTYFIPDSAAPPPAQTITYQHPQPGPYWNQPVTFYQNNPQTANPTPPQRFSSGPIQTQAQPGFMPTGFPSNYLPPPSQPTHNSEIVPVFPNQPLQVVYQNQPTPPNPIIYQNQPPMIFSQNPIYPPAGTYPPPQMTPQHMPQNLPPYPQGTPTPSSCASSTSGPIFNTPNGPEPQGFLHLTQSIQQLSLGGGSMQTHPNYVTNKGPQQFDFRQKSSTGLKGNKFTNQKSFMMGSSQSSTGTNSPAATVIAGYCPPQNPSGMYRTPPETPPNQFTFPPNFNVPPIMYRQMGNVRANTPGTARSSRSPTPASDVAHFERQRMPLPANIYQGMPYVVSTDPRVIPGPGRGQPSVYRQAPSINKQNFNTQGSDNRSHKGRKSKANKQSGLPPSGKQV